MREEILMNNFKWHEDPEEMFKPFFHHGTEEQVRNYMYMGHDDEKTYYKHSFYREYFNVYHNGKTEGEIK
jgi:hypothetical protein